MGFTGCLRLTAEIGFWFGEEYWGKGYATQAIQLIVIADYGFKELELERIQAGVFDFNVASMKALEKSGFNKEGVFRRAIIKNGNICDEYRFAKLKIE